MTSFKFPPPPPPPPKASSQDSQPSYPSQRGGRNRGGGDSGRGRGGYMRGGAGHHTGTARGGHNQAYNGRGNAHGQGGSQGYHNNRRGGFQTGGSDSGQGQQRNHTPIAPIQGMNTTQFQAGGQMQPHVDPAAFAQAMSFIATPAGAQSMAAFASHMASGGSPAFAQASPPQHTQPTPRYSPTQQAGQKRKWEEGHKPAHTQSQRKPKPPRAKADVPPAIPTFGFALPKPSTTHQPIPSKNQAKDNRKSKVKLGLTQDTVPDESSEEEEDLDEETALGAKIAGGGYAFEHDGENISLQTAGDIAEWIKDRRRNFPTHQKAMEKAEAAAIKRKKELEFVRKLKGKPEPQEDIAQKDILPDKEPTSKMIEKRKADEKKREELAALRKKLHESMVKKKEAPVSVDLGLGYGSETESGDENESALSESSVVSSLEDSSEESDSDSDESDAPPEPVSSKAAPPKINIPPPVPVKRERKPDKEITCAKWRQHGKCPFGHSCKFNHPPKENQRVGLYDKLVEQELVKTDQMALEAIKYLGQHGYLG